MFYATKSLFSYLLEKKHTMKHLNKLWIFVAILSILSCNSDDDDNSISGCEDIGCTEQFVTITVSVIDQNLEPFAFTSFLVINTESGEDVTPTLSDSGLEFAQQTGTYPIQSDGDIETGQIIEFQFIGFIDDIELISSNYVITADCCHIDLISGNITLILE